MTFKGVVFYSSYIPSETDVFRGEKFLQTMRSHFSDYLICIGIQVNSCHKWIEKILEYDDLEIIHRVSDEKLYVNSDVVGYQMAIKLFYENKKNYKFQKNSYAWFGHTKGVTTKSMEYHNWVFPNFWENRDTIEKRLLDKKEAGCFGSHLSYLPDYNTKKIKSIWDEYYNGVLDYEPIKYMYVNTFFVIKFEIFYKMVSQINEKFFSQKINGVNGEGDRYFFERDFIHFVDMMGYQPIYDGFGANVSWRRVNENDYYSHLSKWIKN
jgi:hypothetical protein